MINSKFYLKKAQGNVGVKFFVIRHNELLKYPMALLADMEDWNIEGSDLFGERMMLVKMGFSPDIEGRKPQKAFGPYLEYGGIEVKTIGADQFLPRFGVDDIHCGTLGFPLWSKTEDLSNGWTGYIREDYGNMKRWMEPSVENRGARPLCLVHLLKTKDVDVTTGKEHERFFAAIIFEDVDALLDRLTEYLLLFGLDLRDWESIPIKEKARKLKIPELYLQGNMVQVPMYVVEDLATVTMIGDDPVLFKTGKCSVVVQEERLKYLKKISGGRWIPQKRPAPGANFQTDKELLDAWHRIVIVERKLPGLMDRNGNLL